PGVGQLIGRREGYSSIIVGNHGKPRPFLRPTSNSQRPTSNSQSYSAGTIGCWAFDVGCWMFWLRLGRAALYRRLPVGVGWAASEPCFARGVVVAGCQPTGRSEFQRLADP